MTQQTPIVLMGEAPERRCSTCGRPCHMGEVVTVAALHDLKHVWCAPYLDYEPLPYAQACGYIGCPYPAARHQLCRDHHILMCAIDADEPTPESEAPHGWRPNRCPTPMEATLP